MGETLMPIELYSIAFPNSPNPWKVAIVLEELGLEYKVVLVEWHAVKKARFTDLNPNGRTPVIVDPNNNGLGLWELVAIVQYLIKRYDTEFKLSYAKDPEKYHINQWLLFQASGQGPYFGQAMLPTHFHLQIVPPAVSRYRNEVRRVLGVLDIALEGGEYLVEDRLTVADLSFVLWHNLIPARSIA